MRRSPSQQHYWARGMDKVPEQHLDEDVLERYAMNSLPENQAELVEDHTALCAYCMDRLDGATAFVTAVRKALHEHPVKEPLGVRLSNWLFSARAGWTAALVAAAVTVFFVPRPAPLGALSTVVVGGTRGTATIAHGTGPFDFKLFMPEAGPRYHVVLLDSTGTKNWEGDVPGENGNLHAIVQRRMAAGQYFLRVTEQTSQSVHEFALTVKP